MINEILQSAAVEIYNKDMKIELMEIELKTCADILENHGLTINAEAIRYFFKTI